MSHHFYYIWRQNINVFFIWIWMPQITLPSTNIKLNVSYCTLLKTSGRMNTFSWLKLLHRSERTKQFMWHSARIMAGGTDFKTSLWRRIKTNLWAMRLCCCNPVMCWTFMGVSSDQWKNGVAAVGTHTLTSVDISNTFFTQLWWQMLFIAGFSELYLSLYPYLTF